MKILIKKKVKRTQKKKKKISCKVSLWLLVDYLRTSSPFVKYDMEIASVSMSGSPAVQASYIGE